MSAQWLTWTKRIICLLGLLSTNAFAEFTLNMSPGVSPVSVDIHRLHMIILWVCVVIGIVVYGAMLWAIIWHRKARGVQPATFHESTTVEVIWTIVPFIILLAMAVPATRTLIFMTDTSKADITIKITGHRWFWQYEYPEENISYYSYLATPEEQIKNFQPKSKEYLLEVDKPLVVPVGKKIRFLVTAKDVVHSWWVPLLGVKRDAFPGFIHEAWTMIDPDKPGIYRGQCAELCGANHGFMPIVVEAKSEAEYHQWLVSQKTSQATAEKAKAAETNKTYKKDELMKHGEEEYNRVCAMCHKPDGKGLPPTFPALAGSKVVTDKDHTEQLIQIIRGKNAMPPFGTQLSDLDIAAIATYERNSFGNQTGEAIQPSEVKKVRDMKK